MSFLGWVRGSVGNTDPSSCVALFIWVLNCFIAYLLYRSLSCMWKSIKKKKKKDQIAVQKHISSRRTMSSLLGSHWLLCYKAPHLTVWGKRLKTKTENERGRYSLRWYYFPLIKLHFLLSVSWLRTVNNSQYRKNWTSALGRMILNLDLK